MAQPLFSGLRANRQRRVPILMYHRISTKPPAAPSGLRLTTHPDHFRMQVKSILSQGFTPITFSQLPSLLQSPTPIPKSVIITADDAYEDFYIHAFPILKNFCCPATLFVPTRLVDLRRREEDTYCSWSHIQEMSRNRISIGSHTVNHVHLSVQNDNQIAFELNESKRRIEDRIGVPVAEFSYPFKFPEANSRFVARLREHLREAGYRFGVTTQVGCARSGDNPLLLPRIPVSQSDDEPLLMAKLNGGYDWLRILQRAHKHLFAHR